MRTVVVVAAVLAILAPPAAAQAKPGFGPGRVIVIRPGYAELHAGGRQQRAVWLPAGPVKIETLVRSIGDPSWATLSKQGVLTLKAGVSQRPGTELHVKSPVRAVRLTESAYLSGTRSTVLFDGVAVAAAKKGSYVRYLNGSTFTAKKAVFEGLGSLSTEYRGVTVGSGGVVTAVDTVFRSGARGLDTYRAARVTLTRVSATGNSDAGIVINQAGAIGFRDVTATENAGSGMVLRGPLPVRSLTGTVRSSGNRTGVELSRLGPTPTGPLSTDHNAKAGVVVDRCPGCVLTGLTATDENTAVLVERDSRAALVKDSSIERALVAGVRATAAGTRLDRVAVTPAPTGVGVRVPPGVPDVRIGSSSLSGGAVAVSTDGDRTTISDVTVTGSRVGVRVGGNADQVAVTRVNTVDTEVGLVANSGSRAVNVARLRVSQRGGRGIRSAAEQLSVRDSDISGAEVGLELKGRAAVVASSVSATDVGVRAGERGQVEFTKASLRARIIGLRTSSTSYVVLTDSSVEAPRGAKGRVVLRGDTHFPALPLRWIGVFGLAVLAAGIVLEVVRRLRERRHDRTTSAPDHVTNTT